MLAGFLRGHLARIHLGRTSWGYSQACRPSALAQVSSHPPRSVNEFPWVPSKRTASTVSGDRSTSARTACSKDWWL